MSEKIGTYQWIHTVNHEDFHDLVLVASHERPILAGLWAEWCSPCVVIAPVLKQVIADCEGRLHLAKVEVDVGENMKLAGHCRVRGFPTVILFENGAEQGRFHGARPARFIESFIEDNSLLLRS